MKAIQTTAFLLLTAVHLHGGVYERIAWTGAKTGNVIECAVRLHFTGLAARGTDMEMTNFCARAKSAGLNVYWWLAPLGSPPQVMSPADTNALTVIMASKDPYADGYQCGGEPLAGRHDVLTYAPACFHHPEVMSAIRVELKRVIEKYPDVTGIAFDGFGYQNYRFCDCPVSRGLLADYRAKHPDLSAEAARDRFSLETLATCYNDLADLARSLRPTIKTTCHVWPTFLPEPLYGNRLNLNSTQQTAAWFFKPYWTDERITRYTRAVVQDAARYYPRQIGIPFIGLDDKKGPDRLRHELRQIFSATPSRSLGIFVFDLVVTNTELEKAIADVFREFGIITDGKSR